MKVIVCVEPWGLSDATRAALALALRLESPVVALAAAEGSAEPALAEAVRLGAARGVQVLERALESLDVASLGRTLAEALRSLGAEVVLCGARSDVEGRGVVPAAIAHQWGALYLPYVEALSVEGAAELTVQVRSAGRKRRLAVPLPAVITVGASLSVPPLAASASSQSPADIEVLRLDDPGRTINLASDLGTLERPRRTPIAAASARDLLRHWGA